MIVRETAGGPSFKGAALYYLHDKRAAGEAERLTTDRVAWTHVCNLPTDDPERAWRMMAHTALVQAELKAAAGIKTTGNKLKKPVHAYSLSWHPEETPSRDEMLGAALSSMKALGIEGYQAIIVAHNDTAHPHVHILVNRVNIDTGLAINLGNSHLALSDWALAYQQERGQTYCPERQENHDQRNGKKAKKPKKGQDQSRPQWAAAQAQGQDQADGIRADQAGRFADQMAAERYQAQRRYAEAAQFYRDRKEGRAAIQARHAADPEGVSRERARIAALLARANPDAALAELTRNRSTFTRADLARLVSEHTDTVAQFQAVMARLEASAELVLLGSDDRGRERYTTRSHQAIEQAMERHARLLHTLKHPAGDVRPKASGMTLSPDQDASLRHVLSGRHLTAVTGYAGSGKSTMLNAARQSWEAAGYRVQGATLSGIAADGLKAGAGIDSRTIHSRLFQWEQGQNLLTARDVLVLDEAGMIGSRQMERILSHVLQAKAKIVLVGDPQQLQAIEAGSAFKAILARTGGAEMTTVRRQKALWQQGATKELAVGHVGVALQRYEDAGMVHGHETQDDAKTAAIEAWHQGLAEHPGRSQIILAYTRKDVRELNDLARAALRQDRALGEDHSLRTESGRRDFAVRDRLYFLKNDNAMGVRNGSLGTIERITGQTVTVKLDGAGDKRVVFSLKDYAHIDHGYAATIHKSQGVTVDRAHLLASRNLDRHSAYVAMTRHRDRLDLHWSKEAIPTRTKLERILSREALKDTSLDYGASIEPKAELKRQAADDVRARIDSRAKIFAEREQTAQGRMTNARSLAGHAASVAAIARLAVDSGRRAELFEARQATLKKWASSLAKAGPSFHAAVNQKPRQRMHDVQQALLTYDRETAALTKAMTDRHAAEVRAEEEIRFDLTMQAAAEWQEATLVPARREFQKQATPTQLRPIIVEEIEEPDLSDDFNPRLDP